MILPNFRAFVSNFIYHLGIRSAFELTLSEAKIQWDLTSLTMNGPKISNDVISDNDVIVYYRPKSHIVMLSKADMGHKGSWETLITYI